MNFLKEWYPSVNGIEGDVIDQQVEKCLSLWERGHLRIVHGRRERSVSDTYGLPYTSSSSYAMVSMDCNVDARLIVNGKATEMRADHISISEDMEIVLVLRNGDETETMYVTIGYLKGGEKE